MLYAKHHAQKSVNSKKQGIKTECSLEMYVWTDIWLHGLCYCKNKYKVVFEKDIFIHAAPKHRGSPVVNTLASHPLEHFKYIQFDNAFIQKPTLKFTNAMKQFLKILKTYFEACRLLIRHC